MKILDIIDECASGKKSVLVHLLCSATLWPLLGEAAPGYRVWCGNGLYSSHISSCIGTEGKVEKKGTLMGKLLGILIFLL